MASLRSVACPRECPAREDSFGLPGRDCSAPPIRGDGLAWMRQ